MLILVDRNCYLLFILGILFLMVVLTCAQKFDIQFSYLSSSNESQDRGLPPGTEHIYLNSEAVKKTYHSLYGFYNSLLHIWPKNTTCSFLNTFTTISSGFQRNLPLKVRSFAVGGQIQERQKREVQILFTKNR